MNGLFFGVLFAPRETFRSLSDAPAKRGAVPIAIAGVVWASLALVLALSSERPSRPVPFIPSEMHYAAQAAFVIPLFFLCWLIFGAVAGRIADGRLMAPLGYALGVPLVLTWALPDAIAYLALGFDALRWIVRLAAPITAAYTLFLATVAIRAVTGASTARAFAAALLGLIAQGAAGAWALR